MSLWLQEEMKKLDEHREKCTPKSGHTKITVIVFLIIEAALLVFNQLTPDYNALPLCGIVGFMGILIIVIFASKSQTIPDKPKLPNAVKCIEQLHFSPEELQQFDAEMMAAPLALIKDESHSNTPIILTQHYMARSFFSMGEIDYNIFRLSDIAMTCYASSRNGATINPLDKIYDIDLLNNRGEKIGGVSISGKKNFMEFNGTLEKYAPDIQLNVPYKDVKKIRKNS